jgi:predicted dehydrogenase
MAQQDAQVKLTAPMPTRRQIIQGAATVGAALAVSSIPSFVHAGSSDVIKVGLVGCGGRGGGAAANALNGDPNCKLVALADMFKDKLEATHSALMKSPNANRIEVPPEHQFVGWDAYKGVIETCDVVLLATPPHFRPIHLKAVVEAGKHVFCEKPVATDGPGLRSVMESAKLAKEKNISLVSGLCYRYDEGKMATVKRIHEGALGDISVIQTNYLTTGLWSNARKPDWSDMEWQLRNWLYFTWLSGDLITEQHIHSLDKVMWVMNDEPPASVVASGGRTVRTQAEYGNVYDHFNTMYEWKSGVRCFSAARQWVNCVTEVSDWVYGSKGKANVQTHQIWGENPFRGKAGPNMYDLEHVALFKSIRDAKPINNGDYMVKSTCMAIMGRMAAYTGQKITWDQAMNSKEDLAPAEYEFGPLATPPIAVPGKTKQV